MQFCEVDSCVSNNVVDDWGRNMHLNISFYWCNLSMISYCSVDEQWQN